jgi:hypothetical protein
MIQFYRSVLNFSGFSFLDKQKLPADSAGSSDYSPRSFKDAQFISRRGGYSDGSSLDARREWMGREEAGRRALRACRHSDPSCGGGATGLGKTECGAAHTRGCGRGGWTEINRELNATDFRKL